MNIYLQIFGAHLLLKCFIKSVLNEIYVNKELEITHHTYNAWTDSEPTY